MKCPLADSKITKPPPPPMAFALCSCNHFLTHSPSINFHIHPHFPQMALKKERLNACPFSPRTFHRISSLRPLLLSDGANPLIHSHNSHPVGQPLKIAWLATSHHFQRVIFRAPTMFASSFQCDLFTFCFIHTLAPLFSITHSSEPINSSQKCIL